MRQSSLLILILALKSLVFYSQSNPGYATFSGQVQAAPLVGSGSGGYDINITSTAKANHPSPALREKNRGAKLYMKLDLGNDYVKNANWTFSIKLEVTYSFNGGTGITKELHITEKSPEVLWLQDVSAQFTPVSSPTCNVHVEITENTATGGLLQNFVSENIRFKAQLVREYDVDVRLANGSMSNGPIINAPVVTNRAVDFTWQPNVSAHNFYPNYQLQILKLYNTDPAVLDNANQVSAKADWSRALTVETQSYKNTIKLTIAEGSGFYLWRVRPIGNYFEGGIANSENYGAWSYCDENQVTLQKSTLIVPSHPMPYAFYVTDPDENLNWIYNRVFTEGDSYDRENLEGAKVSEGITYADGLQRVRQTQKHNSEENTNITSQTLSDFSGRPALSTLPVPTKGGLTGYKPGFVNAASTGTLYTADDFDKDNNLTDPALISDGPSSSFNYYSTNTAGINDVDNTNVPGADGYAFKRTLYKADGTSRVQEESGVGKAHSLGIQSAGQGRTTRILYGVPSEDELIQIFGLEAPLAESVIKTTTIDQNNVISVSYTSKEGKTIATALTSSVSPNLEPLASAHTLSVTNSANKNVNTLGKVIATKRISIPADNTNLKLSYNLNLPGPAGECITGNCNYRLKLYMVDVKTLTTYESDADVTAPGASHFTTSGSSLNFATFNWNFVNVTNSVVTTITPTGTANNELILNTGEYIFVKELYSGNGNNYADSLVNLSGDKVKLIMDVITTKMKNITNEQKRIEFEEFITLFKSKIINYNANPASEDMWAFLEVTDPDKGTFPRSDEFNLDDLTEDEKGSAKLQMSTKCCGPLTVLIPSKDICVVCHGSEDRDIDRSTPVSTLMSENANVDPKDIIPFGLNDFEQLDGWRELSISDQREAIKTLVDWEFINLLRTKMEEEHISTKDLWLIAPGFSFESLNFMISNMLLSRYYVGGTVNQWGTTYDYTIDVNGNYIPNTTIQNTNHVFNDLYPHNYDCQKLIESWTAAVELLNSFELEGNDNNILAEYDNSEGPGEALKQFLMLDNWPPALKTTIQHMEGTIENILNKFKNSRAGSVPSDKINALTSLTANFMEYAGYQFAAIIDGQSLPHHVSENSTPEPDDYFDYTGESPNGPLQIYTSISFSGITHNDVPMVFDSNGSPISSTCGSNTYNDLYYPYILKPEWMFKYYVYNVFNDAEIPDNDLQIPHQVMTDITQNYNEPSTYLSGGNPGALCYLPITGLIQGSYPFYYTHNNWSATERFNFYELIKSGPACAEEKGVSTANGGEIYAGGTLPECRTKTELKNEALEILNEAVETVQNKKLEIKLALVNELTDACWNIVTCRSQALDEITDRDIDAMVEAVIQKCITLQLQPIINAVSAIPDSPTYGCSSSGPYEQDYSDDICYLPRCTTSDCNELIFYDDGTLGTKPNRKLSVTHFKDCDQKLITMLLSGSFLPHIQPPSGKDCTRADKVFNQCGTGTECDENNPNPNGYGETPGCAPSQFKTYSKHYDVTAHRN